jgi:hypothetical protein
MLRDFRSKPVRSMVVMGESNAYGMCATDPQNEWVQVVASHIRSHQDGHLRVLNNSIPSNVISPASPEYRAFRGDYATAPSALERYSTDMIAHGPDLAIYAYGLNDSLAGHEAASFLRDYETIVSETRRQLPDALIVLVGPYWNPPHDLELWSEHRYDEARERRRLHGWGAYGDDLVTAYNEGIRNIALESESLFVDIFSLCRGAHWLIHADACHFTDVGQATIGMAVFTSLAVNCSFLSVKSTAAYRDGGFLVRDTGGTNALPQVVATWRYFEEARPPGLTRS